MTETNSLQFLLSPSLSVSLLNLYDRTDEASLKYEIARVFVNIARSLCKGSARSDLAQLQDKRVLGTMLDMLRTGQSYPLLVNEAVVGLSLITVFCSDDKGERRDDSADIRSCCNRSLDRIIAIIVQCVG
jgi:hypothetical protein